MCPILDRMTSVSKSKLVARQSTLLKAVGEALYGHHYKRDLARGLRISRSTLHLWLADCVARRDLVEALHELVARERDRLTERDLALSKVAKMLARKRAKQQEIANASN